MKNKSIYDRINVAIQIPYPTQQEPLLHTTYKGSDFVKIILIAISVFTNMYHSKDFIQKPFQRPLAPGKVITAKCECHGSLKMAIIRGCLLSQ